MRRGFVQSIAMDLPGISLIWITCFVLIQDSISQISYKSDDYYDESRIVFEDNPILKPNNAEVKEEIITVEGPPGVTGPKGPKGCKGRKGLKGNTDYCKCQKGKKGEPGGVEFCEVIEGEPGAQGLPGLPGFPGLEGPPCSSFDINHMGLKCPEEFRLTKGQRGDKGERWRQTTWQPAIDGLPGPPGTPGMDGKPGIPGDPGKKGERGVCCCVRSFQISENDVGVCQYNSGQSLTQGAEAMMAGVNSTETEISKISNATPGTLAMNPGEDEFLHVKTSKGWRKIKLLESNLFTEPS